METTDLDYKDEEVLMSEFPSSYAGRKARIRWYRPFISRVQLAELNQRSDFKGAVQTFGFLFVLILSSGLSIYSSMKWPWYITLLLVFINGHFWQFIINGFHELLHDAVFKTKWINRVFLRIFGFGGWHNPHLFRASHAEHHKYTLMPPDDGEVVLPLPFDFRRFWFHSLINITFPYIVMKGKVRTLLGGLSSDERYPWDDEWVQSLFPLRSSNRARAFLRFERIILFGHLFIAIFALANGFWIIPLVITFPQMFGGWLQGLCNTAQHIGLKNKVTDFRLCSRTIYLNPILQFLYWHMNYHTEHHMFAAVPCYKLKKLHVLIKKEMPYCPNGLLETWQHISRILKEQKTNPEFQFEPILPNPRSGI
jgi:fatty acid desaturase